MSLPIVYLADLRHNYNGVLTSDAMPLGIGFMKAVMVRDIPGIDCRLFAYPQELSKAIHNKVPDVLMVSNYMWNEALSYRYCRLVKELNPNALVVMGGPNIPIEEARKIDFVKNKEAIDLYVTGEGDFLATELVKLYIESHYSISDTLANDIHSSVYPKNGDKNNYVVTAIKPRTNSLDDIPSPWLTGIMDEFFDGKLCPLYETNRGCPFTCTFCVQGTKWYTKVNYFNLERIRDEVFYIGKKNFEKCPEQKIMRIADPNFGMFERDIEISSYLGETQRLYSFPLLIDATTGKNRGDRIIQSMEKVNGALLLYQAVQSLDEDVLKHVQRTNISLDTYQQLQVYVKSRGMKSSSDLIFGLPGDSTIAHLDSLKKLVEAGTNKLNCFQALMLKGSDMEKQSEREKFGFKTKFRLLPKNFGIYDGEKVFDVDEVIIGSHNISFDEYMRVRTFHFVIGVIVNSQRFILLQNQFQNLSVDPWSWIQKIAELATTPKSKLAELIKGFHHETKNELFDSIEELQAFYNDDNNFKKLISNEVGDNLFYKYTGKSILYYWDYWVETAINAARDLYGSQNVANLHPEFWEELQTYMIASFTWGRTVEELLEDKKLTFTYDIHNWLETGILGERTKIDICFEINDSDKINMQNAIKIWDYNPNSVSMFIKRIHPDWFHKKITKTKHNLIEPAPYS